MLDSNSARSRKPAGRLFIDSGAFSVFNGSMPYLDIPEYCNFLIELNKRDGLELAVIPDMVGNFAGTKANTVKFVDELNGRLPLEKIVGVVHCNHGMKYNVTEYCALLKDVGISYLAVGGIAGMDNRNIRDLILNEVFNVLDRDNFRVHLLGLENPKTLLHYLPESSDASSYLQSAKRYVLSYVDDNLNMKNLDLSIQDPIEWNRRATKYKKALANLIATYYDGINEDRLLNQINRLADTGFIACFNLFHRRLIETQVQEKYKDYRFWITEPHCLEATEAIALWYDMILVSYASFYQLDPVTACEQLAKKGYGLVDETTKKNVMKLQK